MSQIRVLHCPTSVGGNPQGLACAERKLGLLSNHAYLDQNIFQYPNGACIFNPQENIFIREVKRWKFLLEVTKNYDLIHFNFGQSLAPQRAWNKTRKNILSYLYQTYAGIFELSDLSILKKLGKRIVVTYQGDDARQGNYCVENFEFCIAKEVINDPEYYSSYSDHLKRQRIKIFSRYADKIYALNPDLLYVLPEHSSFLPYSHINLDDWQVTNKPHNRDCLTILHAPSHRGAKGTRFIVEAVNRLKAEGIAFEFMLIEGLPNQEAQKLYERADLLIDQLLAGWYGGVAVELMALGKPVIAYIRESDLRFIPKEMAKEIPIINANPNTVYKVLKFCLTDGKDQLLYHGMQCRKYVEKWHNPLTIAQQLKHDYESILQKQ